MTIKEAYNTWAQSYDSVENKTRDLEKQAAQQILQGHSFTHILELGCGTGKNTEWLAEKAQALTALDFSNEMLEKAREKVKAPHVNFRQADLLQPWDLPGQAFDLISCSLVLEHIQELDFIFSQAWEKLQPGGWFYLCELHPFKQYLGSKARFTGENGLVELEVYIHSVSEYVQAAMRQGFRLQRLDEWFDDAQRNEVPRLISFVFEK